MKKLVFIMPLMAISLLASCNNGGTYILKINAGEDGKFPSGVAEISLNVKPNSNLLEDLSIIAKPTYGGNKLSQTFNVFTYDDGNPIGADDKVTSNNIIVKGTYRNKTLEECSWEEISVISSKGKDFARSRFGDINPDNPLNKTVMVNNQPHTVRIIGYGQDVDENNNEIGITFEFANLISDAYGYSLATYWKNTYITSDSNYDYRDSSIRKALTKEGDGDLHWFERDSKTFSTTFANTSVLDMLPSDLSSVLKTVKKTVNVKIDNWAPTEFNDKLFLLNPNELGLNSAEVEESATYNFYENGEAYNRIKKQVRGADGAITSPLEGTDLDGEYSGYKISFAGYHYSEQGGSLWWLRSPRTDADNAAWRVNFDGGLYYDNILVYNGALGVAPAFCI